MAFVVLLSIVLCARAQAPTLELALLPSLSTRNLFEVYRPLRDYLAREMNRPVRLVTAKDYRTLILRTRRASSRI